VDARTGLVIGGMTAVAASVAVVCVVAMTNTAALKDSPATTVAAAKILVPAASPTATPAVRPTAAPTPEAVVPPQPTTQAEVVEAPDPTEVEPTAETRAPAPDVPAPTAPEPPAKEPSAKEQAPADVDEAIAAAQAAGTWDSLRAWAAQQGWSAGRLDALIARLERGKTSGHVDGSAEQGTTSQKQAGTAEAQMSPPPAPADPGRTTSEHPAKAGSNGHGKSAGPDKKKDQSRNSPDRRD
jgi:hypothetical protein